MLQLRPPAAEVLARFCAEACVWERLPREVRERSKELLLDLLGVALRGSAEPSSHPAQRLALEQGAGGATLIGAGACAGAAWAALANGTAAHAIEMDDVTTESSLHPGVAVIPAALAVAEERGSSPSALLEALVAGYEVTMRVGNAVNPASAYARGFHPTGVAGGFGAAIAAGKLMGLDAEGLTRALGIAGSMVSGSLEYLSDGSWTKRLNAGWACHVGIVAAELARGGFGGPPSILDGRLGALRMFSDEPYPERLLADLGQPFQALKVSFKPYACCRYNHGLIDGVLRLRSEHGLSPADVEHVRLGVLSAGALLVAEPIEQKRAPRNVVDAQFSAPFAAAVALAQGAAGFGEYTQRNVDDAEIRSLMAATDCFRDSALDAVYPSQWPARVELQLRNGRQLTAEVPYATGEPENPVSREALVAKFTSLTAHRLSPDEAHSLAERILHLEAEPDLKAVTPALR